MKTTLLTMVCWMVALSGCTGSSAKAWTTVEDCSVLELGDVKDDCWGHFIVEVYKKDAKRGMEIMQQEISNDSVRDYLWLEITRKVDPTTTKFCQMIQSKTLLKRCQTLVSRPHLHRETLRKKQESSSAPQRKPQ
tara:strand:- start:102 stop:506 length:405 start_codon:yes stop_codon:yes gene_type:complete